MDINGMLENAKELQTQNGQANEEISNTVGGDWMSKVNNGVVTAHSNDGQVVPHHTKDEPVLPPIQPIRTDNVGSGIIIDKPKEEPQQQPIKLGGISPTTMSNINSWMEDMEHTTKKVETIVETIKEKENTTDNSEIEETLEDESEKFKEDYQQAVVIIDKTGMGTLINFTEEEREKLEKAKTIRLEEVETVELKSIKTKKVKKGAIEKILKRQPTVHTTPVVLPASGYTATIKGCSTYELISLIADTKNLLIDTETKWSLIHSKIESTSIGEMDFNTFLQKTASIDYNIFIFGILCATYPDDDTIPLVCENKKCGKEFEHKYSIRSLIRAEKMSDKLRDQITKIVDASHIDVDAKRVANEAPVNNRKLIKLPISEYVVELYVQSAYDFLYKSIKSLSENKEPKYNQSSVLSSLVNKILIPDLSSEDESYFEIEDAADIAKIIYSLKDKDLLIITKQGELLIDDLSFEFGLMDVSCPHCKHHENTINLDLDSILFYKYQQAMNTKIE